MGDYFLRRGSGPFAASETDNFLEIAEYARKNPDTILLMGNHDFEHTPFTQYEAWECNPDARTAIMSNLDIMDMAHVDGNIIFAHGGVTASFLRNNGLKGPAELNALWKAKPHLFDFIERDPETRAVAVPDGDDTWQTPIWARDMALIEDGVQGFNQVVGHTVVTSPETMETRNGDRILFTCTLDNTLIRIGGGE